MKQPLPYWVHVCNMIASLGVAVFVVARPHAWPVTAVCWFGAFLMLGASIRALRSSRQTVQNGPRG
jgi:hypothetical protein